MIIVSGPETGVKAPKLKILAGEMPDVYVAGMIATFAWLQI
jgi:hypothetical protein